MLFLPDLHISRSRSIRNICAICGKLTVPGRGVMVWMRRHSIRPCSLVGSSSNAPVASRFQLIVLSVLKVSGAFAFTCQSAFNGDPLSASEYDPPPGGWDRWGGVRDPLLLSEVETTAQPDLFYADHPRLPFHRCTTKRSFCNQTRWVKLDADFPPSGSSLQAFPHGSVIFYSGCQV